MAVPHLCVTMTRIQRGQEAHTRWTVRSHSWLFVGRIPRTGFAGCYGRPLRGAFFQTSCLAFEAPRWRFSYRLSVALRATFFMSFSLIYLLLKCFANHLSFIISEHFLSYFRFLRRHSCECRNLISHY